MNNKHLLLKAAQEVDGDLDALILKLLPMQCFESSVTFHLLPLKKFERLARESLSMEKREVPIVFKFTKDEKALIQRAIKEGGHRSLPAFAVYESGQPGAGEPVMVRHPKNKGGKSARTLPLAGFVTRTENETIRSVQNSGNFHSLSDWLIAVAAKRLGGDAMEKFLVEVGR